MVLGGKRETFRVIVGISLFTTVGIIAVLNLQDYKPKFSSEVRERRGVLVDADNYSATKPSLTKPGSVVAHKFRIQFDDGTEETVIADCCIALQYRGRVIAYYKRNIEERKWIIFSIRRELENHEPKRYPDLSKDQSPPNE